MKIIEVISQKIESNVSYFIEGMKEEARGTKEAAQIVKKYLSGIEITDQEEKILKAQIWDTLKMVGVVIPFILIPGASILIPILIRVAKKNNIELLPEGFIPKVKREEMKTLSSQENV